MAETEQNDTDNVDGSPPAESRLGKRILMSAGIGLFAFILIVVGVAFFLDHDVESDDDSIVELPLSESNETKQNNDLDDEALLPEDTSSDTIDELTSKTDTTNMDSDIPSAQPDPVADTEFVPTFGESKSRLGTISGSFKTSGDIYFGSKQQADSTTNNEVNNTPQVEMTELEKLRQENEELKKKLDQQEKENLGLNYKVRTLEYRIGTNNFSESSTGKRKYEKLQHFELAPQWGKFSNNVPKEVSLAPAGKQ